MGKDLKGLFLAHRRELQAYLTDKLRDAETAADLTQETFLRYAEHRQDGNVAIIHDRSYLYRTAHNLAIDHIRQQARQHTDVAAHDDLAQIPADHPSQEDVAEARERLDRLRQIVEELPARTRQVFVLSRVEELSYREIAARLDISESSVQKHLAKALQYVMLRLRSR